jgi:D-alanyl-D-alanine carboxypeptidase-like protein
MRRVIPLLLCAAAFVSSCAPTRVDKPKVLAPSVPVLVWSSRDLPARLHDQLGGIQGVRSVTPMAVAVVNLTKVTGAPALPHRRVGGVLPMSIAAFDPPPGATDAMSVALNAGEGVLTETSATLRRMREGGTVTIQGAGTGVRRTFRIGAIVSDAAGRGRELIIPMRRSAGLGFTAPRALLVAVGEDRLDAAVAAMKSATTGLRTRIHVGANPVINPDESPVLAFVELKTTFGEFTYKPRRGRLVTIDRAWVNKNIVQTNVPLMGLIKCNKALLPQLTGAMLELKRLGLASLIRSNSGCWSPRMQVGNTFDVSRHAFGIAVDLNAPQNPYGETPHQDHRLIEVMERWGFVWGGRWLVPDGMHFEFVRFVKR